MPYDEHQVCRTDPSVRRGVKGRNGPRQNHFRSGSEMLGANLGELVGHGGIEVGQHLWICRRNTNKVALV